MALFVFIGIDKADGLALRMASRETHFTWARVSAARIKLGGPFLGEGGEMAGSLMIFEADDQAAAEAFSAGDPYRLAGLFERTEIRPWRVTFGALDGDPG